MIYEVKLVGVLHDPGDFMVEPYQGQKFPYARITVGYLYCPRGCAGTVVIGDDQFAGRAPLQCPKGHRFYFRGGNSLIEIG